MCVFGGDCFDEVGEGRWGVYKAANGMRYERKPGVKHRWFWFRSHFLEPGASLFVYGLGAAAHVACGAQLLAE